MACTCLRIVLVLCFVLFRDRACALGHWTKQNSGMGTRLNAVHFVSEDEGWVVGDDFALLHTSDGGATWEKRSFGRLSFPVSGPLLSVYFPSKTEGWVTGTGIFHTADRGETWELVRGSASRGAVYDAFFVDSAHGWMGSGSGMLYRIRRSQGTWVFSGTWSPNLHDVFFLGAQVGWTVGTTYDNDGRILHTTDGGDTWSLQKSDVPLWGVWFVSLTEGWIVGDNGTILHTTDGGESWREQNSRTREHLRAIQFTDPLEGWIMGDRGSILHTTDGGRTWQARFWITDEDLRGIWFVSPTLGWVVGDHGTILRYDGVHETLTPVPETPGGEPVRPEGMGERLLVRIGEEGTPWRAAGTLSDLVVDPAAERIRPARVDPEVDLTFRVREGKGRIWSTVPSALGTSPMYMVDIDPVDSPTAYRAAIRSPATVYLDLGSAFPVHRIWIMPAQAGVSVFALPQHLEVGLNDGDARDIDPKGQPLLYPVWGEDIDGFRPMLIEFPPRPTRYVGLTVSNTDTFRIYDVSLFADGYVSESVFLSKVVDFGELSVWGHIRWKAETPADTRIEIRTRSGDDQDPNVYHRRIGDAYTPLSPSGGLLTREEYSALGPSQRGPIALDTDNWSFWSPPYPFDRREEGVPVASPDARRYLQIQTVFRSAADTAAAMSWLSLNASRPPAARYVLAEILPTEVEPAQRVTFTYALRPRITGEDTGFDGLEIRTPVKPTAVHSVTLDDAEVPFSSELLDDPSGFIVRFPKLGLLDDNGVLKVMFDCLVFRYGTAFEGHVYTVGSDLFPQSVRPGDALEGIGDDDIVVRIDLESPLILLSDAHPNPFTPNEDGINDETELRYGILKLSEVAEINVTLYTLSGMSIRMLYAGQDREGLYVRKWDGRNDEGRIVPPGIYLYCVTVDADNGRERAVGSVGVAY